MMGCSFCLATIFFKVKKCAAATTVAADNNLVSDICTFTVDGVICTTGITTTISRRMLAEPSYWLFKDHSILSLVLLINEAYWKSNAWKGVKEHGTYGRLW